MARIPTGNFGSVVAEGKRRGDTSAIGRGIEQLGQGVEDVAQDVLQQQKKGKADADALTRAKATNGAKEFEVNSLEVVDSLGRDLYAGTLDEETAKKRFETELQKRSPDLQGLDPITQENVSSALRLYKINAELRFGGMLDSHRRRAQNAEYDRGEQLLQRQAALPGADIAAINQQIRTFAPMLQQAGLTQAEISTRIEKFQSGNWENLAERSLTDRRNDDKGLAQLQRDLGDTKGFFADKLDPEKRNGLLRNVVTRRDALRDGFEREAREHAKLLKEDAARDAVENILVGGGRLDPKDTDQRKFVDDLYSSRARDLGLDEPVSHDSVAGALLGIEQRRRIGAGLQLGVDVSQRTGIVPRQFESLLRRGLNSPEPLVAGQAADAYGRLKVAAPELVGQVDQDIRSYAELVNSMVTLGTDVPRAVASARAQTIDAKPEVLERRKAQWKAVASDQTKALADFVDRDFDPGLFHSEPAVAEQLGIDFDAQTERYFTKNGDKSLARDLAWQDLTRIYGVTEVNGRPTVAAFPVERFGVTAKDVRADLAAFLKANPAEDGSAAGEIQVIPDSMTLRQVTDALSGKPVQPSYSLVTKSGDLLIGANGLPQRYTLPSSEGLTKRLHEQQAEALGKAAANVEGAKRDRDRRRRLEQERVERFMDQARGGTLPRHGGLD